MTQPLRREPLRKLAAVLGVLSICLSGVLGLTAATASANPTLDADTQIDCDPEQTYDEDDAGLAEDLADDGYSCTALLNKGQLNQDEIDQVGELWFLLDGDTLQLRTILFGQGNDNYTEAIKVCLDDDTDPINDLLGDLSESGDCNGANVAGWNIDGDDDVPSKDDDEEDPTSLWEVRISDIDVVAGDPAGWDVDINDFTEVGIHFNADDYSIVAFFQPGDAPEPEEVTPAEPTFDDPCQEDGTITITPTEGVTYFADDVEITTTSVAIAEGETIVITAEPSSDDYVLDPEADDEWTFTNEAEESCGEQDRTVDPADPTLDVNTACGVEDTVTIPSTEGVTYLVDGVETAAGTFELAEGDTVVITVELDKGLVLAEGAEDEWTFTGSDVQGCSRGSNNSRNPTTTTTAPVLGFTPEPEVSPEVISAPVPELALTPEVAQQPAPQLPFTGSDNGTLTMWAVGLLGLGSLLILGSRKRTTA